MPKRMRSLARSIGEALGLDTIADAVRNVGEVLARPAPVPVPVRVRRDLPSPRRQRRR